MGDVLLSSWWQKPLGIINAIMFTQDLNGGLTSETKQHEGQRQLTLNWEKGGLPAYLKQTSTCTLTAARDESGYIKAAGGPTWDPICHHCRPLGLLSHWISALWQIQLSPQLNRIVALASYMHCPLKSVNHLVQNQPLQDEVWANYCIQGWDKDQLKVVH